MAAARQRVAAESLCREFNEGRPTRSQLRPRDLRARAITAAAAATQNVDATALTMGVDSQMARRYLDTTKAFDRAEILKQAAGLLLPQKEAEKAEEPKK